MTSRELKVAVRCRVEEVKRKNLFERARIILRELGTKEMIGSTTGERHSFKIPGQDISLDMTMFSPEKPWYLYLSVKIAEERVFDARSWKGKIAEESEERLRTYSAPEGLLYSHVYVCSYHPGPWERFIYLNVARGEIERNTAEKEEFAYKEKELKQLSDAEREMLESFKIIDAP